MRGRRMGEAGFLESNSKMPASLRKTPPIKFCSVLHRKQRQNIARGLLATPSCRRRHLGRWGQALKAVEDESCTWSSRAGAAPAPGGCRDGGSGQAGTSLPWPPHIHPTAGGRRGVPPAPVWPCALELRSTAQDMEIWVQISPPDCIGA